MPNRRLMRRSILMLTSTSSLHYFSERMLAHCGSDATVTDGANAISILTDEQFFQGALQHLVDVREQVALPVLRKDFVIGEIQIAEASANGADAILLIVAALTQKELVDLSAAAAKYQIDALMEVHTLEEIKRALDAGAEIIGINNRNLAKS